MHYRLRDVISVAAVFVAPLWLAATPTASQAPSAGFPSYTPPRTEDGKPNLNGIWQSVTTANWDLEAHGAQLPEGRVLSKAV